MQSNLPEDFRLVSTTGSLLPGEENQSVVLAAGEKGRFTRFFPDEPGPPFDHVEFDVEVDQMLAIWRLVQQIDFFSMDERYASAGVDDGAFASITVTANGKSHTVEVENVVVTDIDNLIKAINLITPADNDLRYEGPLPEE